MYWRCEEKHDVTVQTAGKLAQEAASSLLVSGFMHQFSHRMNIRCFLTGFFGQEDEPSELLQHDWIPEGSIRLLDCLLFEIMV